MPGQKGAAAARPAKVYTATEGKMTKKEKYHYRKENNICVKCGEEQAIEGKTRCWKCEEKGRKKQRDDYYFLKAMGICTICKKEKAYKGGKECLLCRMNRQEKDRQRYRDSEQMRKKISERGKRRYERLKEEGSCTICGKTKDIKGSICDKCKTKRLIHRRIRYYQNLGIHRSERTNYGECFVCGQTVSKESKKLCERCLENSRKNLEKVHNNPNFEMLKQREIWKRKNQLICR